MANIITGSRILLSLLLLLFRPFSPAFLTVYLLTGITDMLDGPVARKTGTASELGERLDTAADICFFAAAFYMVFPEIHIAGWLWVWVIIIALLKVFLIFYSLAKNKKLPSVHSKANRAVGVLLFIFPLTLSFLNASVSSALLCALASFAALQEGCVVLSKE